MTSDRSERKYLVPLARAQEVADAFSARFASHRFTGEGANLLPGADHFVTTIYFDTPSRHLYHAAHGAQVSLKLRAKEYYDLHPALIDVATDPRELVRYHPVLWLEIKHKDGERTGKRRLAIPKRDVAEFFRHGRITSEMLDLQRPHFGSAASETLSEVAALCARFGEPVAADALVNYRRLAWQDPAGELRLTLDLELAFYRPPDDLFVRQEALVREALGAAVGREPCCVLEVKSRAEQPAWLAADLAAVSAEARAYSKFEAASKAVHG
jgi:hypothetical protein